MESFREITKELKEEAKKSKFKESSIDKIITRIRKEKK